MIKVIINGACGRMGKEVEKLVEANEDLQLVAKVDKMASESGCYNSFSDVEAKADVIIDFSNHLGTAELCDYAVKTGTPTVIATTGHTEDELEIIKNAAEKVAIFHSANMSLGVALLIELAKKAAAVMPDADIEIVETHHNRKLDAPSGTALMIANALKKVRENAKFVLGRAGNAKRESTEIGIHAVRRGNIVGIHEVLVSTDNQTITLKHEAHSRALFADGAISAARFLCGKPAGMYEMNSIITE